MTIPNTLVEAYAELLVPPADADANWLRQRGFRFERLINTLLTSEGLEPRTGYKPAGEQIDGSFFLDGSVLLLEAKWHVDPLPASTLYQFKGKVDGKLVGTLGVFVSMSGYSKDAVDALTLGKTLNIVLFDKKDMDAALTRGRGFKEILKRKLRQAAEEGVVYAPTQMEVVTRDRAVSAEIEHLRYDSSAAGVGTTQPVPSPVSDLIIICEGDTDGAVISTLARRILSDARSKRTIEIIAAMGKFSIPRVANALWSTSPTAPQVLIVLDGDGNPDASVELLNKELEFATWKRSVPNPSIESWLGLDPVAMHRDRMDVRAQQYRAAAAAIDLQHLRDTDSSFAEFYKAILG